MSNFLYPRTVTITRPGAQSSTAVGYQGQAPSGQRSQETQVASGIPCSIQARNAGGTNAVGLPNDGARSQVWRILTPLGALADGQVQDRDIATDDLNRRFRILSDYTNSLGSNFICERVEA